MFGQRLFDIGVLIHWLRLSPGEMVLDFGAGSCWLSMFLHRFGCRTVAVDISRTVLELGRRIFERDPATDWNLCPEFIPYDGHSLALDDESVDKIIIYDAFHHIPNQEEILRELSRVLKKTGIMAMCEPGRFHATTGSSFRNTTETGILENSIIVEDIADRAKACGFKYVTVVPISLQKSIEVPARELNAFLAGKKFADYWLRLRDSLIDMDYILFFKETYVPDTRRPGRLEAIFSRLQGLDEILVRPGERTRLRLLVNNVGDTCWLSWTPDSIGKTQLGAHLYRKDSEGAALDFEWYRLELVHDVAPGGGIILDVELPPLQEEDRILFDMVSEQIAWFHEFGSKPLELYLRVVRP